MPLGSRELLLTIRARDVASRVIREVGTSIGNLDRQTGLTAANLVSIGGAMTGLGAMIGATGAAALVFFNDATNSAMEYRREAALALTQADGFNATLDDMIRIGRNVSREIPAAYESMQPALYDIFSSTQANLKEAEFLLRQFAINSVAGQTDIQNAAQATIAIMNAWQLPFEDASRVSDIQFEIVRKGVLTYEELTSSIGRAIPAAVRSGQSFEQLGAMMSFMTRNGMSAEMSATSAARALESMANAKTVARMEEMGIKVRDATGEFLPMVDIVGQLSSKLSGLPTPERVAILQELFKGAGGTIQARRFWDMALTNFEDFRQHTEWIQNSAGATADAYDIMFNEPASQAQLMKNRMQELKDTIGDELIPIKMRLLEAVGKLLEWWNGLDEGTQSLIIKFAAFSAAAAVVVGIVLTLVGGFLMMVGILAPLVGGIKIAIGVILGMNVVMLALLAIGLLLIMHWDTVKKVAAATWEAVAAAAQWAWDKFMQFIDWLVGAFKDIWPSITAGATDAWNAVVNAAQATWDFFVGLYEWFMAEMAPGFIRIWESIRDGVVGLITELVETAIVLWQTFGDDVMNFWNLIASTAQLVWNLIVFVISVAVTTIISVVTNFIGVVIAFWTQFWNYIVTQVRVAWNFVSTIVASAITIVTNIIQLALNIIQGDWRGAWENIKNILKAAWNAIIAAIEFAWGTIRNFFANFIPAIIGFIGNIWSRMYNVGRDVIRGVWDGVLGLWPSVRNWFANLPSFILGAIGSLSGVLIGAGKDLIQGLMNGIGSMASAVADKAKGVVSGAVNAAKSALGLGSPSRIFRQFGVWTMEGYNIGLIEEFANTHRIINGELQRVINEAQPTMNPTSLLDPVRGEAGAAGMVGGNGQRIGLYVEEMHFHGNDNVEELDWWTRTTVAGV